jgi:quercetin dioxygenase-like cupin family protein
VKRSFVIVAAAIAIAALIGLDSRAQEHKQHDATAGGSSKHQVALPDELKWEDAKALPPGAKVAVLEGDPQKEGFFTMRIKLPAGYKIPPHTHPCPERVTVLSGTFHLGQGEKFDDKAGKALPAGSYTSMPPGMRHYAWSEGETVLQLSTIGPWGITYVNPADDPRKAAR